MTAQFSIKLITSPLEDSHLLEEPGFVEAPPLDKPLSPCGGHSVESVPEEIY